MMNLPFYVDNYAKIAGVKYHYVQSSKNIFKLLCSFKKLSDKQTIQKPKNKICIILFKIQYRIFFAYSLAVGSDLSVNKLLTQINTQLASAYDIYSVNVSFDDGVSIN